MLFIKVEGNSQPDIDSGQDDSGEIELGLSECKVTSKITVSNIMRYRDCDALKVNFTLSNKIINIRAAVEEDQMRLRTNIPGDFQQFGFQTLNDFEFLLNDATTADVAIKVTLGAEKIFHSHKVILAGTHTFMFFKLQVQVARLSDELFFHFSSESSFSSDVRKWDAGSRRKCRCY